MKWRRHDAIMSSIWTPSLHWATNQSSWVFSQGPSLGPPRFYYYWTGFLNRTFIWQLKVQVLINIGFSHGGLNRLQVLNITLTLSFRPWLKAIFDSFQILEEKVEYWMEKYDRDVEQKQHELDVLKVWLENNFLFSISVCFLGNVHHNLDSSIIKWNRGEVVYAYSLSFTNYVWRSINSIVLAKLLYFIVQLITNWVVFSKYFHGTFIQVFNFEIIGQFVFTNQIQASTKLSNQRKAFISCKRLFSLFCACHSARQAVVVRKWRSYLTFPAPICWVLLFVSIVWEV